MNLRLTPTQQLRYAGLFTWACVGMPILWQPWYFGEAGLGRTDMIAWQIAYFLFGLTYWLLTHRLDIRSYRRPADLWLLLLLAGSAIGVSHFSDSGLGSILLMLVAAVLPWLLPVRLGVAFLVLQHGALIPVFSRVPDFSLLDAVLQAALYVGFSSFVFVTSFVARQQAAAREEQRRLNAELRATRALLAESTRLTERTRISRELHDLLGHHLTALSLNLEVASHLSAGKALDHVRQAQSLAKLLLSDVREAVSQLRQDDRLDVAEALRGLVEGVPALDIDLKLPDPLRVTDMTRAQVILRTAQEIITNTVKHSGASKLTIELGLAAGGVSIRSRDDGRGSDEPTIGHGLRGMRERLEQIGGTMTIDTARGRGFGLDLWLPLTDGPPVQGD